MFTSDKVPADMNATPVLANLPDFKQEKSALQSVAESRGHILLMSPKFYREVADVGIDYSWENSKQVYRRKNNEEIPRNLHRNIVRSLRGKTFLTLERIRRFARRTRDFCWAYFTLVNEGVTDSKDTLEKMRKISKAHRNIIDMESAFIDRQ